MLDLVRVFGYAALQGRQTLGRRKFGVPPGGAFDQGAWRAVNAALGLKDQPAWEVVGQATFRATGGGSVALVGDGTHRTFPVAEGETFVVGPPEAGLRLYVLASGGPAVVTGPPRNRFEGPVRVWPGPQAGLLGWAEFLDGEFGVSPISDRVGIRLEGTRLPHSLELPSEPACVGAIQITGDGTPVILGPDGPTIGGYPKVAVVAHADLDRLAQLAPGAWVRFVAA